MKQFFITLMSLVLLAPGLVSCQKDTVHLNQLAGYWTRSGVNQTWYFGNGDLFISASGSTFSFSYSVGEDGRTLSITQVQMASVKVVAKYSILRCDEQTLSLQKIELPGVVDEFTWDTLLEFQRRSAP